MDVGNDSNFQEMISHIPYGQNVNRGNAKLRVQVSVCFEILRLSRTWPKILLIMTDASLSNVTCSVV